MFERKKLFLINTNATENLVHNLLSTFKNYTPNSQYKTLIILGRMQQAIALGKGFASRNRSYAYRYIFSRQMEACVFSTLQTLLERVAQIFYDQLTVYCVQCSLFGVLFLEVMNKQISLLPTSQPSEDARLARRQRIVPREEWCMQKNSRSALKSVSVRCKV